METSIETLNGKIYTGIYHDKIIRNFPCDLIAAGKFGLSVYHQETQKLVCTLLKPLPIFLKKDDFGLVYQYLSYGIRIAARQKYRGEETIDDWIIGFDGKNWIGEEEMFREPQIIGCANEMGVFIPFAQEQEKLASA